MNKHGGVLQLCLTYACQCACDHCGVKHLGRRLKRELSLTEIGRLFVDLKISGFCHVDLSGGEPTLRKDLFKIIKLGKRFGFSMSLETNGIRLVPSVLLKLKESGIDVIYLSLDDFRSQQHDEGRGRRGVFQSAVAGLCMARQMGMRVHVSMVPSSREYFKKGMADEQIRFCLENGAEKVRILFPSYVGKCADKKKIFCSEADELRLLDCLDSKYHDVVYVESEMSPLAAVIRDRKVLCPAKSVFSYVAANGYVMPCPYLPVVFGDVRKESVTEILSRMHESPFMRRDGLYCPTRDKRYLATSLKGLTPQNPFIIASNLNKINCHASCGNRCGHCQISRDGMNAPELLRTVKGIDKKYKTVHLYGGDIFTEKDIFSVLEKIARDFEIVVHTNARVFTDPALAQRLQKLNIKAVKVPFFAYAEKSFERITRVKGSYRQTLIGIANLGKAGIPVSIYVPEKEAKKDFEIFISLGVVSVSWYTVGDVDTLSDSVLCFGSKLTQTHLLWLKK